MRIVWTQFAIDRLKEIFEYYAEYVNKRVAHKIRTEILSASKYLEKHPESGQIEENLKFLKFTYRYILIGNYKLIYRIEDADVVLINDVFDVRRDPDKMLNL